MDSHSLRVLEYDAIRQRVVGLCSGTLGQERATAMEPSTEEWDVRRRLAETTEAARLAALPGGPSFGGIHDIRPAIRLGAVGGVVEAHVLLMVADTVAAARKLRAYLLQRQESAPALAEHARRIVELPHLEAAIYEAIDEHAEVRDDATGLLLRLRRELRATRQRMTDRLHAIVRSPVYRDMLQDPVITTRDGRYCIPVKSEYRVQFGGLVHDQSSSGATVFMEPTSVVELGNELRQTEVRERQEVERILRELTGRVGSVAEDLFHLVDALGELEFIWARARLGLSIDATEPLINKEGFVGLRRARHPLLAGPVVPVDIELGREHSLLIITGPNTGGKTVSLKTAGLLALMAQSGLHIPAHEGSTLPIFRGIFADIGDEQSIQQSLSTFSGHITNIARILGQVDELGGRSLVLMDEVGAGTDPGEGAALAKAILQHLHRKGARTIATTHYGELKEFAYSTPGVQNASVEFDLETLRPTYRLLIGIPGSSNAFSIAARLGLPAEVVETAQGMIGTDRAVLSQVIEKLTEEQRATDRDSRKAAQAFREVEEQREKYARDLRQLQADRIDILNRARSEAAETVRNARREIDRVREELRQIEKDARKAASEPGSMAAVQKVRERLQALTAQSEQRTEQPEAKPIVPEAPVPIALPVPAAIVEEMRSDARPPAVGDLVWVADLNQRGTLLTPEEGGKAQVRIGSMRLAVPWQNLQRIMPAHTPAARPLVSAAALGGGVDARLRARVTIAPEVNLRGMRAEEALSRLEEYVDEACMAGLSPMRIVHGKGTGALKRVVWEYLRTQPNVSGFHHPPEEEGGSGVTIVELRE